ncbi:MAG: HAD-IIB family hydrolase, partial [Candidatus Diapherotrites archaeon]|nr:HAD-IIB family hydrolase [Candidatus Diapherotrites archaeon]
QKNNYQLLITLDANSETDINYSNKIKKFVKEKKLPVTIGFGYDVISATNKREIKNGKVTKYTIADLFEKAQCIVTTSTLEGFGFAFTEGWLANREVVGRRIDFVMTDFENNNLTFPGFYTKIKIDEKDFGKMKLNQQLKIIEKINPKKLLKQKELNKTINAIITPNKKAILKNKKAIEKEYSLKKYYSRFEKIVKETKKFKNKDFLENKIDNSYLIDYFSKDIEKKIIITDLDGTLLDHNNYSHLISFATYKEAQKKGIPVCFCSSKSFDEQICFRKIMKNPNPFIAENGSAIYIPKNYFPFKITNALLKKFEIKKIKRIKGYDIIELNVSHDKTYKALKTIQKKLPFKTHIFTDHSIEELEKIAKLPKKYAILSKTKYYANGCRIPKMTDKKINLFKREAKKLGFETKVGGRFVGINKGSDKGKATKILLELFRKKYKKILSIGLGDSENDFLMLKEVDKAFLVKRVGKSVNEKAKKEIVGINILDQIGPKGWNFAIKKFL